MHYWLLTPVVFILDRLTKLLVVRNLAPWASIPLIERIFSITHVRNTGAAFGMFGGAGLSLIVINVLILVLLVVWHQRMAPVSLFGKLAIPLIAGGALGNLYDRIAYGYVIDFLDFHIWPVFNVADMAIVLGCALLIWAVLRQEGDSANARP